MVYLNLQIENIAQGLIAAGYSLGNLPANALVANGDTAPSSPTTGQLWLSSVTNALSIWNGVSWDVLGLTATERETIATLSGNVYTKAETDAKVATVATSVTLKQDLLVSGTTIKTVNGVGLLGSGNVLITTPMGFLNDIQDTTIATPISGQVLSYDGTKWINTTPASGITDHTLLSNIGTNTHAQIDSDLSRLVNTSGTNTGDQDLSGYSTTSHNHTGVYSDVSHLHSGVYEPASANLAKLNVAQTFTGAQRGNVSTITYATTITPDFSVANNFVCTLTGNVIVANPTNMAVGQYGKVTLIQDATGGRTSAYGSYYKFAGGTGPTAVTTANSKTTWYYEVHSATEIVVSSVIDWK